MRAVRPSRLKSLVGSILLSRTNLGMLRIICGCFVAEVKQREADGELMLI